MNQISEHIGMRIRTFRKIQKLTLQQMADQLGKSKATMSKYESGDIILDVETLYEIANLLNVSISQLTDCRPEEQILPDDSNPILEYTKVSCNETSQLFQADMFYFYFYDGRYRRIKTGVVRRMGRDLSDGAAFPVTVTISSGTPMGNINETFYKGTAACSNMLLRISFINETNSMEENMLYVFNPADGCDMAEGLLSGIFAADQIPCAFRCMVSLTPQNTDLTGNLMHRLTFTKRQLQRIQKLNLLLTDQQDL